MTIQEEIYATKLNQLFESKDGVSYWDFVKVLKQNGYVVLRSKTGKHRVSIGGALKWNDGNETYMSWGD